MSASQAESRGFESPLPLQKLYSSELTLKYDHAVRLVRRGGIHTPFYADGIALNDIHAVNLVGEVDTRQSVNICHSERSRRIYACKTVTPNPPNPDHSA